MRRCNTVNDKGEPVMFRRMLVLLDAGLVGRRVVPWVRRLLVPVHGDVRLLVVLPPGRTVTAGSRTLIYADQGEDAARDRSEEHTSELQSPDHLVCRLLLEKKKKKKKKNQ